MQQINWLEFYDETDPNWQLKMIAKKCLHKVFDESYEIPNDIKMKCAIANFDIDAFLKDAKIIKIVKKIKATTFMRNGLFEHNLYANIDQFCSKNVNDHANVHMNLEWLLSDVPLRWYFFKRSKTWNRWYTSRRYRDAIKYKRDPTGWFEKQLKALYERQIVKL